MFYKFNNFIGRLAPSTQSAAYAPQGLAPMAREPSVITFDSKKTKPVHEPSVTMSARPASTSPASTSPASTSPGTAAPAGGQNLGVVPSNPRYKRIVELQNIFLKEDGRMVWQKFPRDRGLYYTTIGLMVVGGFALLAQLAQMAFPKKSQD